MQSIFHDILRNNFIHGDTTNWCVQSLGSLASHNSVGKVIAVDEDNASYLPLCNFCNGHLQESKER